MSTTNVCHLVKVSFIKKRKISPLCCAYSEDKKKTSHSKDVFATRKCKNVKTDIIHKELFCTKIFFFFYFYRVFRCHQRYLHESAKLGILSQNNLQIISFICTLILLNVPFYIFLHIAYVVRIKILTAF